MDDHPVRRLRELRAGCLFRRRSGLEHCAHGRYGVRPAFFVDSEICLSLDQEEIELSDEALLTGFTSKQLVNEVLRRIAAGEDNEDE